MSKALEDYIERVASCPCVLCLNRLGVKTFACEVHHPTVPRNDWLIVSLCYEHHRGSAGVHGLHRRGFERLWKVTDYDLLGWQNEALCKFA